MGGAVTAESGGGNIRIGVAHGTVVASTALGNIELWKLAQGAEAHTGMGRITAEFIGDRNSMRNSELVTSMGDIVVYFAATVPGNIHAVTGASPAHRIFSDFPELEDYQRRRRVRTPQHCRRRSHSRRRFLDRGANHDRPDRAAQRAVNRITLSAGLNRPRQLGKPSSALSLRRRARLFPLTDWRVCYSCPVCSPRADARRARLFA